MLDSKSRAKARQLVAGGFILRQRSPLSQAHDLRHLEHRMDDQRDSHRALLGVHVLVVDDNADARAIFKSTLAYAGAAVLVANSAVAAARTLKHIRPSVVLTDLSMPRRDGVWLIRWIRSRGAKRGTHLPVIAVSARDDVYEEANILTSGFDDYLLKPVEPSELIATIERATRRSSSTAHSA